MLIECIKYIICGQTFFSADEGFPDDFLSLCQMSGVTVKNIRMTSVSMTGSVCSADTEKVFDAAGKSGMRVFVEKETGIPVLIRFFKRRFGIPAGIIAAFLIYCILSSVIWSVEINGCVYSDADAVMEALSECGIRRGAFRCNADTFAAGYVVESVSDAIYRAAVNMAGCRIIVDIVENTPAQNIQGTEVYSNLVASRGGEIIKADILAGTGEVKKGDVVVKGDLLVNGVTELKDGSVIFADSKAHIIARTSHMINCFITDSPEVYKVIKRRDHWSPYLFGLYLLAAADSSDTFVSREEYFADNSQTVFPVGFIRQRETVLEKQTEKLSENRKKLVCLYDLARNACSQLCGLKNPSRKIKINIEEMFNIEAEFICEEDIVLKQYFEVIPQNIEKLKKR